MNKFKPLSFSALTLAASLVTSNVSAKDADADPGPTMGELEEMERYTMSSVEKDRNRPLSETSFTRSDEWEKSTSEEKLDMLERVETFLGILNEMDSGEERKGDRNKSIQHIHDVRKDIESGGDGNIVKSKRLKIQSDVSTVIRWPRRGPGVRMPRLVFQGNFDTNNSTDLALQYGDFKWSLLLTGTTGKPTNWPTVNPAGETCNFGDDPTNEVTYAGDFDGDGRTDIIIHNVGTEGKEGTGKWYVGLTRERGFLVAQWPAFWPDHKEESGFGTHRAGEKVVIMDADGDGDSDILIRNDQGTTWLAASLGTANVRGFLISGG